MQRIAKGWANFADQRIRASPFGARFVYRNDRPRVFRQEMTEAENRVAPVLDVVACGHRNAAMTQGFAGGEQSIAGMNLAAVFFSEGVQRRFRNDAMTRSQASSARISFMQR